MLKSLEEIMGADLARRQQLDEVLILAEVVRAKEEEAAKQVQFLQQLRNAVEIGLMSKAKMGLDAFKTDGRRKHGNDKGKGKAREVGVTGLGVNGSHEREGEERDVEEKEVEASLSALLESDSELAIPTPAQPPKAPTKR